MLPIQTGARQKVARSFLLLAAVSNAAVTVHCAFFKK